MLLQYKELSTNSSDNSHGDLLLKYAHKKGVAVVVTEPIRGGLSPKKLNRLLRAGSFPKIKLNIIWSLSRRFLNLSKKAQEIRFQITVIRM